MTFKQNARSHAVQRAQKSSTRLHFEVGSSDCARDQRRERVCTSLRIGSSRT
jgi:hypothetical protein